MPYTKTDWVDKVDGVSAGTPVTAENLNKIEKGIVDATDGVETLNIYLYNNIGGAF